MVPRLRTIAILMLLAGLALGVFTSRALRAFSTRDLLAAAPTPVGTERIQGLVDVYRQEFNLDDARADLIRQELERYDRQIGALLWELRQQNASKFRTLFDECSERIRGLLEGAPTGAR